MSGSLYHLVPKTTWIKSKLFGQPYFPPTYDADGFIHLTKDPKLLLPVANHFYSDIPGDFLVLCIDSTKLTSEVKFEPAADVGDKPSEGLTGDKEPVLFPHLYGTIDHISVVKELAVTRQKLVDGGKFLSIAGIGENENDLDILESQMAAAKDAAAAAAKLKADTAKAKEEAERERAEIVRMDAEIAAQSYEDTRSKIEAEAAEFVFARVAESAKEQQEVDSKSLKEQQQAESKRLQEQEILETARRAEEEAKPDEEEKAKPDENHIRAEEDAQAMMAMAAVRAEREARREANRVMEAKAETEAKAAVDKVRNEAEAVVKAEMEAQEAEMAMLERLEKADRDAKERSAKAEKDAQERADKEYTRKKEEEEELAEKVRKELEEKSYPTLREYKQIETPPPGEDPQPILRHPLCQPPPQAPLPQGRNVQRRAEKAKGSDQVGLVHRRHHVAQEQHQGANQDHVGAPGRPGLVRLVKRVVSFPNSWGGVVDDDDDDTPVWQLGM